MKKETGVIYVLSNPSFPDYVKIGYATDLSKRLAQLNKSECIPFAFRAYAVYKVDEPLQDKTLHEIIDKLNPDLRAIDSFDGKKRKKEFYAMSKEDAYSLLESIAKLSGTLENLQRLTPEGHEIQDDVIAKEIKVESKERKTPFSFFSCHIPVGSELRFVGDDSVIAIVEDDRHISYNNKVTSLSSLANALNEFSYPLQGTLWFTYKGKVLAELREEMEENGTYGAEIISDDLRK